MKKKIILLITALILSITAIFIYINRDRDNIESNLVIKNETKEKIEAIGVFTGGKYILNKTNGDKFYFPEKVIGNVEKGVVFAVAGDGSILKAGEVTIKNPMEIKIKSIADKDINVDVDSKKIDVEIKIPKLDNWKVETNGNYIKGQYKENTDMNYTIYVLGKGGKLGISNSAGNGELVETTWEKPKDKKDTWLVLDKY